MKCMPAAGRKAKERELRGSVGVKDMGFTHVEFIPLASTLAGSWGIRVIKYYAPDSAVGSLIPLNTLLTVSTRKALSVYGLAPAHFPRMISAGMLDGTPLYEDPDLLGGEHSPIGDVHSSTLTQRSVQFPFVATAH